MRKCGWGGRWGCIKRGWCGWGGEGVGVEGGGEEKVRDRNSQSSRCS